MWVALGVVLGGRIGYVLFYNLSHLPGASARNLRGLARRDVVSRGLMGAALAIVLFARGARLNPLTMLDLASTVAPIGLFFGRIANFINGELWGRPATDFPYAVVFPHAGPLPRHPSQLYEAFGEGLLLFIVMAIAVRLLGFRRPGLLGGIFILGYAVARIVVRIFPRAGRAARIPVRRIGAGAERRHHHGNAAVDPHGAPRHRGDRRCHRGAPRNRGAETA